jgi:prepilin-type processing-associated H-X9-DG protein
VELLVVIGIIALLISVLLPALNAARRQAAQTKCMAALKEIGNTFKMYSLENRGYYPPAKLQPVDAEKYNLYGQDYTPTGEKFGAFWFNFLAKYVQKAAIGTADTGGANNGQNPTKSIFWGCPAFVAYADSTDDGSKGANRYQLGYGMNGTPKYSTTYPGTIAGGPFGGGGASASLVDITDYAFTQDGDDAHRWKKATPSMGFMKENVWGRQGASRCLIADNALWLIVNDTVPASGVVGPTNFYDVNKTDGTSEACTTMSYWRHSKLPPVVSYDGGTARFRVAGSKIAFNILYCDGHVAQITDPKEAFRSVRMKFPG